MMPQGPLHVPAYPHAAFSALLCMCAKIAPSQAALLLLLNSHLLAQHE